MSNSFNLNETLTKIRTVQENLKGFKNRAEKISEFKKECAALVSRFNLSEDYNKIISVQKEFEENFKALNKICLLYTSRCV